MPRAKEAQREKTSCNGKQNTFIRISQSTFRHIRSYESRRERHTTNIAPSTLPLCDNRRNQTAASWRPAQPWPQNLWLSQTAILKKLSKLRLTSTFTTSQMLTICVGLKLHLCLAVHNSSLKRIENLRAQLKGSIKWQRFCGRDVHRW